MSKRLLVFNLKKYFSFPYNKNPLKQAATIIDKKYQKDTIRNYNPVYSKNDKRLIKIFGKKILPITEEIHKTTISLPIAPYIPKKKIKEYCLKINKYND